MLIKHRVTHTYTHTRTHVIKHDKNGKHSECLKEKQQQPNDKATRVNMARSVEKANAGIVKSPNAREKTRDGCVVCFLSRVHAVHRVRAHHVLSSEQLTFQLQASTAPCVHVCVCVNRKGWYMFAG